MPDKKSNERNVRKITKVGKHSYSVTIPISLIRKYGWKEGQKVIVRPAKSSKKKLVIEDWKG